MQYLRQLRLNRGWTQEDVAGMLKVTQATYSDWERGKKRPRPRAHKALAEVFHRPVEEFTEKLYASVPAKQSA